MKKKVIALWLLCILVVGCALFTNLKNLPSVCDTLESSYLCAIADRLGVRLEEIGNSLIIANALIIADNQARREKALKAFKEIKALLENPISYPAFRWGVYESLERYPGLLDVADSYLSYFADFDINMYQEDRKLIVGWLDKRIAVLER